MLKNTASRYAVSTALEVDYKRRGIRKHLLNQIVNFFKNSRIKISYPIVAIGILIRETLIKLIPFMVRQGSPERSRRAHHERNQVHAVRPEPVEGLDQRFLSNDRQLTDGREPGPVIPGLPARAEPGIQGLLELFSGFRVPLRGPGMTG